MVPPPRLDRIAAGLNQPPKSASDGRWCSTSKAATLVEASFDAATTAALYPNHGVYVSQVAHAENDLIRVGFLLWQDAILVKLQAARPSAAVWASSWT